MATIDIRVEGIGSVVADLGRLADAAATAGGARLEVYSPEVYAAGVETGYTRNGRVARRAGGAFMFRQGARDIEDGFNEAVAAALPQGPSAVTRVFLERGRRAIDVIRGDTPVRSGQLRDSIAMRLVTGRGRLTMLDPIDTAAALLAIETELQQCAGIDVGQIGIPDRLNNETVASVSILDGPPIGRAVQTKHLITQHFLILWQSQVTNDERATELRLASFKDAWRNRWLVFRDTAGHPLQRAEWDDTMAARPNCVRMPEEARQYPSVLGVPMSQDTRPGH